jgi:2-C-methyl-D-erythritol 4-phosphate cytidylyltransferase
MKRKVYVILTAAGKGERFSKASKLKKPKQFIRLLGKPVILHSLLHFQKCKYVDEIFVTAGRDYFEYIHSLAASGRIIKLSGLVEGGRTRFESVKNAFSEITGNPGDLVLIHDAARPNINIDLVKDIIKAAMRSGEVIYASKVSETVKRSKNGFVTETLNRKDLWFAQTPQVFRYGVLKSAYIKSGKKNDFTDESGMVERAGYRVKLVEGSKDNIKITSVRDITILKKLMK